MRLGTFGYFVDFFASLACVVVLIALEMTSIITWIGAVQWLICLPTGVSLWTFVEYGVHRWLYHGVAFFIPLHDAHHAEPNAYIGAAPFIGIFLIFAVTYFPVAVLSASWANGLTSGVLLGYMGYQLVHHATHSWRLARPSHPV